MKKAAIFLSILILPLLIQAQVKKRIGFIPYTSPENADKKYRELAYKNIYDAALRVFVNTQRFDVLDRGSFDIIKIEKEFQKGEDLANVEIVGQGRISAAELLAVAKLSTFTITETDDGNGYSVFITAEFKQLDVETGRATSAYQLRAEAKDQQTNILGGESKNRISTIEQAISMAVQKMELDLEKWIKRQFPMILKVIEKIDEEKALVVEGGTDVGMNEKHSMKAISLTIIQDKKLIKTIGKLSFTKEGVGEELTKLTMDSKKDWADFLKLWKEQPEKIYVTEDL
jgi:hypothetical protein